MKNKNPKIKPFKGVRYIDESSYQGSDYDRFLEIFQEMGYLIYEDPTGNGGILISDKVLTFKWLRDHVDDYAIDPIWWNNETDFNDHLDEELDRLGA